MDSSYKIIFDIVLKYRFGSEYNELNDMDKEKVRNDFYQKKIRAEKYLERIGKGNPKHYVSCLQ